MRRIIGTIGAALAIVAFAAIVAGSSPADSKTQASVPCDPCGMDGGTGTELLFTAEVDVSGDKAVLVSAGDQILVTAEPEGGSPMPTSNPVLAAQLT